MSWSRPLKATALSLSILGLAGGCGYSLAGKANSLPPEVRSVFLQPIENRTQRSQVEQFIQRAIADELVRRQRLTLVSERTTADSLLSGVIVGLTVIPVTFDDQGRALRYEISILAELALKRRVPEAVLWSNDRYVFKDNYEIEVDERDYFDRETLVIRRVAEKFAETAVTDILEGF